MESFFQKMRRLKRLFTANYAAKLAHAANMAETTQKGSLDITPWLTWFMQCLDRAIAATDETLGGVLRKAKFWEKHAAIILNDRQRTMLNKLLDGFEGKLNTSKWAKIMKTSQDTALRDIQDLVSKQILMKAASGGRSTAYMLVILN